MFPKKEIYSMSDEIKKLLNDKRVLEEQINRLPYHGTLEIKNINNKKYLYT